MPEELKFQTIVYNVDTESKLVERYNGPVDLTLSYDPQGLSCKFTTGKQGFGLERSDAYECVCVCVSIRSMAFIRYFTSFVCFALIIFKAIC